MYKYLLITWLLAGFVFTTRAQNPDTTGKVVVKSKMDTLKATRQDTDIIRSNVPKIRKKKFITRFPAQPALRRLSAL